MKSVWMVEEGDYSDYQVVAIFETEAEAAKFCKHRESSYREWPLNKWTEEKSKFDITFDLEGNITDIRELAYVEDPEGKRDTYSLRHKKDEIKIAVARGPRDRAIKVASERYAKIRTFLDEAQERVDRSEWIKTAPGVAVAYPESGYRYALEIAEISAGLKKLPNPPQCGDDETLLRIMGIAAASAAPIGER